MTGKNQTRQQRRAAERDRKQQEEQQRRAREQNARFWAETRREVREWMNTGAYWVCALATLFATMIAATALTISLRGQGQKPPAPESPAPQPPAQTMPISPAWAYLLDDARRLQRGLQRRAA